MRFFLIPILGLATLATGCGGRSGGGSGPITPEAKSRLVLEEVGELYRVYTASNGKPPGRIEDLKSVGNVGPVGYKAIKAGEVVVSYSANMTALEEGPPAGTSDEVLAYEKSAPESGGQVLMLDRSVKTMTAAEFKAAKKAGKGS